MKQFLMMTELFVFVTSIGHQWLERNEAQEQKIGCTLSISLQIKPCVCKEVVRKRNDSIILQGTWLSCLRMSLDDDQISRILTVFLSSEKNRNFTRRIDLDRNKLTKIPDEVYQFRRLERIALSANKITSISSRGYFKSSDSFDSDVQQQQTKRLSITMNFNGLNNIEAGAFDGKCVFGS